MPTAVAVSQKTSPSQKRILRNARGKKCGAVERLGNPHSTEGLGVSDKCVLWVSGLGQLFANNSASLFVEVCQHRR